MKYSRRAYSFTVRSMRCPSAGDFPSGGVEDEVVDLERPGRFGRAASQEGSDAGKTSSMANGLVR